MIQQICPPQPDVNADTATYPKERTRLALRGVANRVLYAEEHLLYPKHGVIYGRTEMAGIAVRQWLLSLVL